MQKEDFEKALKSLRDVMVDYPPTQIKIIKPKAFYDLIEDYPYNDYREGLITS